MSVIWNGYSLLMNRNISMNWSSSCLCRRVPEKVVYSLVFSRRSSRVGMMLMRVLLTWYGKTQIRSWYCRRRYSSLMESHSHFLHLKLRYCCPSSSSASLTSRPYPASRLFSSFHFSRSSRIFLRPSSLLLSFSLSSSLVLLSSHCLSHSSCLCLLASCIPFHSSSSSFSRSSAFLNSSKSFWCSSCLLFVSSSCSLCHFSCCDSCCSSHLSGSSLSF